MVPAQVHSKLLGLVLGIALLLALTGLTAAGPRLGELPQSWHDDSGLAVELSDHLGRPVVLTMAYASCHRICPATIGALKKLQAELDARGRSADFVIVGYDPAHDDAASWRRYRALHHLDRANWSFLGGSREDTEQLARALGFEFWNYDEHVMHDSRVVLFDAGGRLVAAADPARPGWAAAF